MVKDVGDLVVVAEASASCLHYWLVFAGFVGTMSLKDQTYPTEILTYRKAQERAWHTLMLAMFIGARGTHCQTRCVQTTVYN